MPTVILCASYKQGRQWARRELKSSDWNLMSSQDPLAESIKFISDLQVVKLEGWAKNAPSEYVREVLEYIHVAERAGIIVGITEVYNVNVS